MVKLEQTQIDAEMDFAPLAKHCNCSHSDMTQIFVSESSESCSETAAAVQDLLSHVLHWTSWRTIAEPR